MKNYLRVQRLNQPNLRCLIYQLTAVWKELAGHKKESYILIYLFIYFYNTLLHKILPFGMINDAGELRSPFQSHRYNMWTFLQRSPFTKWSGTKAGEFFSPDSLGRLDLFKLLKPHRQVLSFDQYWTANSSALSERQDPIWAQRERSPGDYLLRRRVKSPIKLKLMSSFYSFIVSYTHFFPFLQVQKLFKTSVVGITP